MSPTKVVKLQVVKLRLNLEYEIEYPAESSREEIEHDRSSGLWCGDGTLIREMQRYQDKHGCFCKDCTFDVIEIDGQPVTPQKVFIGSGKIEKTTEVAGDSRTLSLQRRDGRVRFDYFRHPVIIDDNDEIADFTHNAEDFTMEEAEFLLDALTVALGR